MDKADAELEEAQRNRRSSRSRYYSPRRGREEEYSPGRENRDSNGLHRAGYTAEHDYDRSVLAVIAVSAVCMCVAHVWDA